MRRNSLPPLLSAQYLDKVDRIVVIDRHDSVSE
jgi:hypothetical protein